MNIRLNRFYLYAVQPIYIAAKSPQVPINKTCVQAVNFKARCTV